MFTKFSASATALAAGLVLAGAAGASTCDTDSLPDERFPGGYIGITVTTSTLESCEKKANDPGNSYMGYDAAGRDIIDVTNPFTSGEKNTDGVGDFSITLLEDVDALFIFIKQGQLGGLFQISSAATAKTVIDGTWFIDGPGNGADTAKKNEFSHTSFYYAPAAAVPLPASLPLLLAGLGSVGFLSRRKRKAA